MSPCDETSRDRGLVARAEILLQELHQNATGAAAEILRSQIVDLTLHLADHAARAYRFRGMDAEDLTQVARLGLMKAIRGYDPRRGCGFAAYAIPTITGELKRHFRDQGWLVRPPRALQELGARVVAHEELLRGRLQRDPTTAEVADELGVDPRAVRETRVASRGFVARSLHAPDGQPQCPEPVADGDRYAAVMDWEALRHALHGLTARQRLILRLRFVDELTQAQIGERIGVSQMQVSRILSRCLAQLRQELTAA